MRCVPEICGSDRNSFEFIPPGAQYEWQVMPYTIHPLESKTQAAPEVRLVPGEEFLGVRTYYWHRVLDGSYGKPHQCNQCFREGRPDGDRRCPYVPSHSCHFKKHSEFPFRLGMEVNTEPVCPACYKSGKVLHFEWEAMDKNRLVREKRLGLRRRCWLRR